MPTRRDFLKAIPAGAILYGLGRGAQSQDDKPQVPGLLLTPQDAVAAALADASVIARPDHCVWTWINESDPKLRALKAGMVSWAMNVAIGSDLIIQPVALFGGQLLRWSLYELAGANHARFGEVINTWHRSFASNWAFNERFVLGDGKLAFTSGEHVTPHCEALYQRCGQWLKHTFVTDPLGNVRVPNFSPLVRWDHAVMTLTSQETDLGGAYYDFRFGKERDGNKILKARGFDFSKNRQRAYVSQSKPGGDKGRVVDIIRGSGGGDVGEAMFTWDISLARSLDPEFDPGLNLLNPRFDATEVLFPLVNGLYAGFLADSKIQLQDSAPDKVASDYRIPPQKGTNRLEGGILSCAICHGNESLAMEGDPIPSIVCGFTNDVQEYTAGGVDIVFDQSALKTLGLTADEANQVIARQYTMDTANGSRDSLRLEFVHRVHEQAIQKCAGVTFGELAAGLSELRNQYRYTRWDAARALKELGVQYEGDALEAFGQHLPVSVELPELRIAKIRGGGSISPEVGRLIYRDMAVRLIANQLGDIQ